jgi:hypothetical protein
MAAIRKTDCRRCLCGGRIVVFYAGRRRHGWDRAHDLCRRCWQAARDRLRLRES